MSDETVTQEPVQETLTGGEVTAPEAAPADPIVDGTVDDNGKDNEGIKPNTIYPEGFDADTYDLEKGSVKTDAVLAKIALAKEEADKATKQAQDLRKIISKGKAPEKAEVYLEGYEAPEGLERYYTEEGNEEVREVMTTLAETAKDMGLNTDQFKSIADVMNEAMVKAGVMDNRTDEAIDQQKQDWLRAENEKLSSDPMEAKSIIDANVKFVKETSLLNDDQKAFLSDSMDKGAIGISTVNVFRELFGGRGSDIPSVNVVDTGLASDNSLAVEFYAADTSVARRQEIVQQRMNAGRKGGLPLPQ